MTSLEQFVAECGATLVAAAVVVMFAVVVWKVRSKAAELLDTMAELASTSTDPDELREVEEAAMEHASHNCGDAWEVLRAGRVVEAARRMAGRPSPVTVELRWECRHPSPVGGTYLQVFEEQRCGHLFETSSDLAGLGSGNLRATCPKCGGILTMTDQPVMLLT